MPVQRLPFGALCVVLQLRQNRNRPVPDGWLGGRAQQGPVALVLAGRLCWASAEQGLRLWQASLQAWPAACWCPCPVRRHARWKGSFWTSFIRRSQPAGFQLGPFNDHLQPWCIFLPVIVASLPFTPLLCLAGPEDERARTTRERCATGLFSSLRSFSRPACLGVLVFHPGGHPNAQLLCATAGCRHC